MQDFFKFFLQFLAEEKLVLICLFLAFFIVGICWSLGSYFIYRVKKKKGYKAGKLFGSDDVIDKEQERLMREEERQGVIREEYNEHHSSQNFKN